MNSVLNFVGYRVQMPPPDVAPKTTSADDFYKIGLAYIEEQNSDKKKSDTEDYDRFALGVEYLKRAANNGHEEAPVVLRSLCHGFARKKIDTRSDHVTWFKFKTVLFAAYQPWEQFAVLQEYPHVLEPDAMPDALRKEIYQSTVEAANQGNIDAHYAKGLMEAKGFGVEPSLINALKSLCVTKREIAEFKRLEAMNAPGGPLLTPQQKYSPLTDAQLDEAIQEIETQLLSILNKTSDGQNEKAMSEADQCAVIEHIRPKKQSLSIHERLSITYADIAHGLPELINDIKTRNGRLTVTNGLQGVNEKVRITTEARPLPLDVWRIILLMTNWAKGASVLSQCDRSLAEGSELLWRALLREWVVIPKGKSAYQLCISSGTNLKYQFIPGSIGITLKELCSKFQNQVLVILDPFFKSINIDYQISEVTKLMNRDWFKTKIEKKLLDLDVVLKLPRQGIEALANRDAQKVLDDHPSALLHITNFSPTLWDCLVSVSSEDRVTGKLLFGTEANMKASFNMTDQGRKLLSWQGVPEFLMENPTYFVPYITVSIHDNIDIPLSHKVIQAALVGDDLTFEQLERPVVSNLLCKEHEGSLAALTAYPGLLKQMVELNSDLNLESILALKQVYTQRMLATGMLALNQLNQVKFTSFGMKMDAQIIIDAAARNVIPTDVTIELYDIEFGSLPNGYLALRSNIRLTSFSLDEGVLMVGGRRWTGPCRFSSN